MVVYDGMEVQIQKMSSNYYQSLSFSPKAKRNCIKFMFSCVADSVLLDIYPLEGCWPHGRASDNQMWDFMLLTNANDVHERVNFFKALINCDRAWERNRIRLYYERIRLIIPCCLRTTSKQQQLTDIIINEKTTVEEVQQYLIKKTKEFEKMLEKERNKKRRNNNNDNEQKIDNDSDDDNKNDNIFDDIIEADEPDTRPILQQPTVVANMGRMSSLSRFTVEKVIGHCRRKYPILNITLPIKLLNQIGM